MGLVHCGICEMDQFISFLKIIMTGAVEYVGYFMAIKGQAKT